MIARIKKKNKSAYDTLVFAYLIDGWNTRIIGFDENFQTLEYVNMYDKTSTIHQQMMIIDSGKEQWVKKDNAEGYDWIINDDVLLKLLDQGLRAPEGLLSLCLEMQKNTSVPEWFEVKDEKSLEDLMWASGGFHDGVIESVAVENRETYITMGVWGGKIHFKLINAELSDNCQKDYGNMGEILDSNIFLEDGRIFWNDSEDVSCKDDMYVDSCWFSATKMFWNAENV